MHLHCIYAALSLHRHCTELWSICDLMSFNETKWYLQRKLFDSGEDIIADYRFNFLNDWLVDMGPKVWSWNEQGSISIISLFLLCLINDLQYLSCWMYTELPSPELGNGLTSQQPVQQIKNVSMGLLDKCRWLCTSPSHLTSKWHTRLNKHIVRKAVPGHYYNLIITQTCS